MLFPRMKFIGHSYPILIFGLLVSAGQVHAESQSNEPTQIHVQVVDLETDFSKLAPEKQRQILADLVESAEDASEGGIPQHKNRIAQFFTDLIQKFNFPKIVTGMIRWKNVNQVQYPDFAADLGLLLLTSHTVETLSGPTGVALAGSMGAPDWALWTIGITGGVISIPGLDPLCFFLGGMYVQSEGFRNQVRKTRLFLIRSTGLGLGAEKFWKWIYQKEDRIQFIQKAIQVESGLHQYFELDEQDTWIQLNMDGLRLRYVKSEQGTYLNEVSVIGRSQKPIVTDFLKHLDWNTRNFVLMIYKKIALQKSIQDYAVLSLEQQNDETHIQVRPHAIPLTEKGRFLPFLSQSNICDKILGT